MSDLATALEMPLRISSYFFAMCRKQDHRLVQLHYVQLLCKTGIRKVHLSQRSFFASCNFLITW